MKFFHLTLFQSLFKGRKDVFAIRWEKRGKSGYMPAYQFDPYHYRLHKIKGGTFQNYPDKSFLPLTDDQIEKHLLGEKQIGIYPLLKDNTSWFIVADFDDKNWEKECRLVHEACKERDIPAYIERSRSGHGGHVWIFFEQPYPAVKSRKTFRSILEQAGIFSKLDKQSSFDRLFPNQDYLSGKGLGNLIAMPLNKNVLEKGNGCFIHPESLKAFENQWDFLQGIQRISIVDLDAHLDSPVLLLALTGQSEQPSQQPSLEILSIALHANLQIRKDHIPIELINFLKEELNFSNALYMIQKNMGRSTYGIERYIKSYSETDTDFLIPRGMTGRVMRFCKVKNIPHEFHDQRIKLPEVEFTFDATLLEHQQPVIEVARKKDFGVIVAPPGSGKTVMGLAIIAMKKQPALIVVHRKHLAYQWMERIQHFLGIPKNQIGTIVGGKAKVGKEITVALIQSLKKYVAGRPDNTLEKEFGTVIVDECHHIPADSYRSVISTIPCYYLYGLTATPFRKNNDGRLIFAYLGESIAEVKPVDITLSNRVDVIIRKTEFTIPFNSQTDSTEILSKALIHDTARNRLILEDVKKELDRNRKIVIITERKEHIDSLNQYLKQSYETVTLSGEDAENARIQKWKVLQEGSFQVLITTGQFFGEGFDLSSIESLFLTYPFSFKGKLIQYIGRIQRSGKIPVIYDYDDYNMEYLHRMFLKRNAYYRKLDKEATLFDDESTQPITESGIKTLEARIKIPFENLKFQYGTVAFSHMFSAIDQQVEIELDNEDVRPEFEVLKPYFIKILRKRFIQVHVNIEIQHGEIIALSASSKDIDRINREIIDTVRLKWIDKLISSRLNFQGEDSNLLDVHQIQDINSGQSTIYQSEETLLEDILKTKQYKHAKHIMFLAQRHEPSLMKIRFVLNPFSFLFLLAGENQYHIVLETLDTEEATYLWHTDKTIKKVKELLSEINRYLTFIREQGRQSFLESSPSNFSRIIHDYSEERKGFILWKDQFEERLI